MGELAAVFSAQPNRVPGPKCSIGILLTTLDAEDAKALKAALEPNSGWKGSEIADALLTEGHKVNGRVLRGHTIQRHRNQDCSCESR